MTTNKKLNIGLFGFGVVGEGIYNVLKQTPSLHASIRKIAIKNDKIRNAPLELFTKNADEILEDESINLVVELIDDAEAAYHIVRKALKNKKHVVSANKKMIAENLEELIQLQTENKVSFLYEAAVCGSIPVIRNLEEYYDNDLLNSFAGIVNGSTNFILTKMKDENLGYENALTLAQESGFAESNPALDVEGIDAVNKLTIVLKHAYGITANPKNILHKGITQIHPEDTQYALEKSLNIKLIATAKQISDTQIAAFILPTLIENNNPLFSIKNEFNGVLIGSKLADEQFLSGKGAGRYPTSSAILSDISALKYDYKYEYKKSKLGIDYELGSRFLLKIFVSFENGFDNLKEDFFTVEESYISTQRNYIIGQIEFEKLKNSTWFHHPCISVISMGEISVYEESIQLSEESILAL